MAALELLAGNFRCLVIRTGEARPVKHLVTSLNAFGERVGRRRDCWLILRRPRRNDRGAAVLIASNLENSLRIAIEGTGSM